VNTGGVGNASGDLKTMELSNGASPDNRVDASGLAVRSALSALLFGLAILVGLRGDPALAGKVVQADYSAFEGLTIIRIEISGNQHTKEVIIRRELLTEAGDSLNLATMQSDLVRLTKLPTFSAVQIVPRREGDGVVYAVTVDETARFIPTILPGNSEENGWYAGPIISTPNWLGRAITASVSAQWGGITKYSFSATSPWLLPARHQLSVSVGQFYQEREDKVRESQEITSSSSIRAVFYPGRRRILSIGLGFQYLRTMSSKPGITLSPTNHDHLYRPELLLRINSIEDPLDPRCGWVGGFQERTTGGLLGGDGDTWRTQVDIARYQPITERSVLAVGAVFDHQTGVVDEDIPGYLVYLLGGGSSVRGYSRTELGKVLYGKNQFLATAEYGYCILSPRQFMLFGKSFLSFRAGLNIVGFIDYGVAWTDAEDLNMDRSRTGFGIGLHAMVPGIERIRLDLGISQDGELEIHIGTRSKLDAQR